MAKKATPSPKGNGSAKQAQKKEENQLAKSGENAKGENPEDQSGVIPDEILESLPPEVKRTIELSMLQMRGVSNHNPILDKITPDHISKVLELSGDEENNDNNQTTKTKWFTFAYVFLGVAVFLFLVIYLRANHTELLNDLVKIGAIAAGGFGAGYGVGRKNRG